MLGTVSSKKGWGTGILTMHLKHKVVSVKASFNHKRRRYAGLLQAPPDNTPTSFSQRMINTNEVMYI